MVNRGRSLINTNRWNHKDNMKGETEQKKFATLRCSYSPTPVKSKWRIKYDDPPVQVRIVPPINVGELLVDSKRLLFGNVEFPL
jgi:hypothetical protein